MVYEEMFALVVGLEKGTLRKMQKRIVKSFLDILIMAQLRQKSQSAYDITAFIHKRFDFLMSTGTVYSTLYSLERDGLVQGSFANRQRRARIYTLTEKGKKTVQAFLKVNDKIQLFVVNFLGDSSE